jgi:16S rRNA G966 N2-methylase RsmD
MSTASQTTHRLATPIRKIKNAVIFIWQFGPRSFIIESYHRAIDLYHDRRLNVDTRFKVRKEELRTYSPDYVDYAAIRYSAIYFGLKKVTLDKTSSTFLDYGSGKGRPVIVAATFPFKRVIGVEISDQLSEIASCNIKRMKNRKCRSIEIHQCNATEFAVPTDVNLIYFFNPFRGNTLRQVVMNVYASYVRKPRKLYILFFNNDHFERVISNREWLVKTYEARFSHGVSFGIYETRGGDKWMESPTESNPCVN